MLEGWRKASVDEICETVSVGIVIKPSQYYVTNGEGIRAFRSANVGENKVVDRDWVYLSKKGHEANKKSALREGDVLVVRSGAPGTACVVPKEFSDSNCIDVVFARPDRNQVLPEYLAGFTNSDVGKRHILGNQGGLALKHFNVGAFKQLEVLLPPISVQRKIVAIMRTWDNAIEVETNLLDAKKAMAKGFAQRLLPVAHDGNWPRVSFESVFSRKVHVCGDEHGLETLSVTKAGIVRQSEYFKKSVTSEDTSKYLRVCRGDFVMSGLNFWMGAVDVLTDIEEGIVSPAYKVFEINPNLATTSYMRHFVRSHTMLHILRGASIQGASIVRRNLDMDNLLSSKFSLPSIEAQEKFANALDLATDEIELCSQRVELLKRQKRGLMQKLLTGEWRVEVSDDEEAAA